MAIAAILTFGQMAFFVTWSKFEPYRLILDEVMATFLKSKMMLLKTTHVGYMAMSYTCENFIRMRYQLR